MWKEGRQHTSIADRGARDGVGCIDVERDSERVSEVDAWLRHLGAEMVDKGLGIGDYSGVRVPGIYLFIMAGWSSATHVRDNFRLLCCLARSRR